MKRIFDVIVSALSILLLAPLLLATALAVRFALGSPVVFRQERPGLKGRGFTLLKFRTMTDETDSTGRLLPDGQRLTPFGVFLRKTSVDELPQLVNVLRGDMSLVGPRPLLTEYLPLYSQDQQRRHDVRPGLTGWSQIKARNAASWQQRLAHDVWYVENQSFVLDLKILAATLGKVRSGEGVTEPGEATASRFTGNA